MRRPVPFRSVSHFRSAPKGRVCRASAVLCRLLPLAPVPENMAFLFRLIVSHLVTSAGDPSMPNVLIVDDDAFVRTNLRDSLAGTGFDLSEAADGEEACRLAAAKHPEVILLDLVMPRQSGLEALERIRSVSPDSQVIVITSLESEGLIDQVLTAGARDFVTKPFHPLEIIFAVQRLLKA